MILVLTLVVLVLTTALANLAATIAMDGDVGIVPILTRYQHPQPRRTRSVGADGSIAVLDGVPEGDECTAVSRVARTSWPWAATMMPITKKTAATMMPTMNPPPGELIASLAPTKMRTPSMQPPTLIAWPNQLIVPATR